MLKKTNYIISALILVFLGFLPKGVQAQQDAMYTHYMQNNLSINPAYAGTRDALSFALLHRSQWTGFVDEQGRSAASTQTFTAHTPLEREEVGVGLSIINDRVLPVSNTGIQGDFSYKMRPKRKAYLSFGLKASLDIRRMDLQSVELEDQDNTDPAFQAFRTNRSFLNIGTGIYYYTEDYYFGISIPRIFQNNIEPSTTSGPLRHVGIQRHYYFIGGYDMELSDDLVFKPTVLMKITNGAPVQLDLTPRLTFKDFLLVGLMYRTGDAVGMLLGVHMRPDIEIGYSFDMSLENPTFQYNGGSHEIVVRYDVFKKGKRKISKFSH